MGQQLGIGAVCPQGAQGLGAGNAGAGAFGLKGRAKVFDAGYGLWRHSGHHRWAGPVAAIGNHRKRALPWLAIAENLR